MKTGIQVSSLKPLLLNEAQVYQAFSRLQAIGCRWVQLQWSQPGVSVTALADALRKSGMESVSVQDFYETVLKDFSYYVNLNTATGGKWLCVSRIPDRLKSPSGLDAFVEELRAVQKRLEPLGQQLCFHPVSADFQAIPGMDAVEYLLQAMPELALCLDLYHLNRCCPDMPAYLRRHAGRVCMAHFKDSRGDTLVPAGQGDIAWDGVVKACLDAGAAYGFVEQERWQGDPYVCLHQAMDWLDRELASNRYSG